jgi:hypothetical protein
MLNCRRLQLPPRPVRHMDGTYCLALRAFRVGEVKCERVDHGQPGTKSRLSERRDGYGGAQVNPAPQQREMWLRDPDGYVVVITSPDGEAEGW